MQEAIKGRSLGSQEIKELLDITSKSINKGFLLKNFAFTKNSKPKFSPQDYFVLPANTLYNTKAETTTVGRFIFNKFILDEKLGKEIGYINKPMDDGALGDLQNKVAKLFLVDKIDSNDIRDFLDKLNWLGFSIAKYMNASLSADFVITNPKIADQKQKLFSKNEKEIENGNMKVVADIEKELLQDAKEIYKNEPAMQIYNSGCRGSFNNNYKNTSIVRGVVKDFVDPSKSYVSKSNLDEGIKPEEFKAYCDMSIAGSFGRAVETQDGGYQNKIMCTSFQSSTLDKKGSDCGTKLFYEFELTDKNYNLYQYRIIKDPTTGKLIELNDDNKDKYIGKFVKMRSPLYCKGDKICNMCAGNYFYKMKIENIGLLTNTIGE